MPELIVAASPVKSQSSASTASADAANRGNDSQAADSASGADASFAATLKSQIDKKSASGSAKSREGVEEKKSAQAVEPTAAPVTAEIPVTDITALLPLIEAALSGKLPGQPSLDKAAKGTDDTAELGAGETPISTGAAALAPEPVMTASTATVMSHIQATAPAGDKSNQSQDSIASGVQARPAPISSKNENLAVEAAIAAEAGSATAESAQHEQSSAIQPRDFQAVMDRAMGMHQGTPASGTANQVQSMQVNTPLGQTGWHEEVGQKLTWMVGNNKQQAEIVLTPPQLGRIEVSLSVTGDQATATFTSANPAVREALENSVHRLREVLADAGVTLGQTQVGAESFRQPGSREENSDNSRLGRGNGEHPGDTVGLSIAAQVARPSSAGRGMVDVFA